MSVIQLSLNHADRRARRQGSIVRCPQQPHNHADQHGGQGRGIKRRDVHGNPLCGRCGAPYDGVHGHGPGHCVRKDVA